MYKNKLRWLIVSLTILSMVLTSCAKATPEVEVKPTEPSAPEPTKAAPAVTEEVVIACPPSTVADPMGVPAGKYPQQFDLDEFEALTECEMTFSDNPFFADRVSSGELLPLEERLPDEPLVVQPYREIGLYGGTQTGTSKSISAGGSEFLTRRHQNLVRYSDDLQTIVPNIAKSWEWNEDYTELTFTLREGHKWSDGEPFTADDMIFYFEDIVFNENLTPEIGSHWIFGGEPLKVEKINDLTVKWIAAEPMPGMLQWLGRRYITPMAPKHFLSQFHIEYNPDADDDAQAAGYERWVDHFYAYYNEWHIIQEYPDRTPALFSHILVDKTTEYRHYEANPYYFKVDTTGQQLPYTSELHESFFGDTPILELKVIAGEIDEVAQGLVRSSYPLYLENQESGDYKFLLSPYAGAGHSFAFNVTHPDPVLRMIFSNLKFRQAMSLAINREEVVDVVCLGLCEPMQAAPVHPTVSFAEPWIFDYLTDYDPDQANQMLDEIGLERGSDGWRMRPDGKPLMINIIIITAESTLFELVKEYWEDVGIQSQIKSMSWEAYRAVLQENEQDLATHAPLGIVEPALYGNPLRFYPPFGDPALAAFTGLPWYDWWISDGEAGEEPPEEAKRLFDLSSRWKSALPGSAEYMELGKEIVQIHMDNLWIIGITSGGDVGTVVSNRLGNVVEWPIQGYDYYRTYPFRPDQWYIKD